MDGGVGRVDLRSGVRLGQEEHERGAKQPSLCDYGRTIAPHLFRESSTRLGCYRHTQWKKFETTS